MDPNVTKPRYRRVVVPYSTATPSHLLGIAAFCLFWAGACQAEIYKFVDDNGFVTYTNMPSPGSKPELVIPEIGQTHEKPSTKSGTSKPKATTRSSTPAYFPRVDTGTQRKRDDMRRQLLEEELSSEQRNLSAAKSAAAAGSRQPGADLRKLLDAVR